MKQHVDKWFLGIVIALAVGGVFIFFSAALGLLAREGVEFSHIIANQLAAFFLGVISIFVILKIHYRSFKYFSFYIFLFSIILTAAVFIPHIGFSHGGALRWLSIGPFSLQPSEFLKIGFILYFAAWLSGFKRRIFSVRYGLLPFLVMIGIVGFLLLKQPDTGTFMVIFTTGIFMFIASGAPWRHVALVSGTALTGLAALAYARPYIRDRFLTFFDPSTDPLGAGYQLHQSLIAVGSGELFGRGFGQSIQKFNFLPEPVNDSIFAVFAEEFGFVGGITLITLFVLLAMRGAWIAKRAPDQFSRLTVLGIVILITVQAFSNIGSMLGVMPLTGLPLPFVSHGGSALIATLMGVGIVLNISRYAKR